MTLFDFFGLLGGLGLFLYGMDMMGKGLESAAGAKLKQILEKLTTNRLMGVLVGTGVTMIIQSSSATTVMCVGFVNAGLMNLSQAFGVMLGANIGTTITAQIIAFNLTDWAPLFIILGVIPMMFAKKHLTKSLGTIAAGFGILFLGMTIMGDSMVPLRSSTWFINTMTKFESPIYGVLLGTVFTGIIQSSSASVGIVQALAAQGLVSLGASLYLVLGCNIGTCATALLASIGTTPMARRTAVMHLINKTVGAIIFMVVVMLLPIKDIVSAWSPGDPSRQIANFHTIFNILNTLLLFPFGALCIKIANAVVKGKEDEQNDQALMYVDDHIFHTPTIALGQIRLEVGRLAQKAQDNVALALEAFFKNSQPTVDKVIQNERTINTLCAQVLSYLVRIQGVEEIPPDEREAIFEMHEWVSNIERISDHAENISEFATESLTNKTPYSPEALEELRALSEQVMATLRFGVATVCHQGDAEANKAACREAELGVDVLVHQMREGHILRLHNGQCDPRAALIYNDLTINLERVADHGANLAGFDDEATKRLNA